MHNDNNTHQAISKKQPRNLIDFDPLAILKLLIKNWYWFIICTGIGLYLARFYIGHTLPVYETTATLLINDSENRSMVDNTELLQGLGLPGGMQNIENQMMILRSRDLTERTLEELPFEIEYYIKTFRNKLPVYPDAPVRIISETQNPLPKNIEFLITYINDSSFNLTTDSKSYKINKTSSFGELIEMENGAFSIECRDQEWFVKNRELQLCFIIHDINRLVRGYANRINVELVSRGASILRISLNGTNPAKDADFINKHLEGFQRISLDTKNTEADRRIQFIDNQLNWITDTLSTTENKLQQFRSAYQVMDLSAQGQSIIEQVNLLENEKARLNLEANYYDYLADYLQKEASDEMPMVPITMGITDPGLTRLVEELATSQSQLSTTGAGELNPLQRNLQQRVRSTKDALSETLNGLRRANSLARSENQQRINRINAQASALPVTERQLLGIERKFKLNDELYTFLLQTRAEQQMQKSSNRADSQIIDKANERFSSRISPDPMKANFAGLFAGFAIPFLIILSNYVFSRKLKDEDIKRITDMPVVGNIPHNESKINTVVFDNPSSSIAEAFRILRSRMQFLTKEALSSVILVTSSMPEDGKTFIAINLASVYSMLDKKTVLIGFDLRKPKIFQDFKLSNEKGVTTWLIGKDRLEDIIQKTHYDNLSVISAGPVPPNPSELTALDKTKELISLLKKEYEYIIIDSSPVGVVSDTYHLASISDSCLLIVRPKKTLKDILQKTVYEIYESGTKSVSMVINDLRSGSIYYGYGEKYGYINNDKQKKRLFRRIRK
ncbi:MAG: polysaccharide biosynthesis tyrosine autokinase [Prolixibacteraceae bacterium]|nr:polysaccharide biosynthesis tyrosine autokinase [Prolixibacteraceae bacterium]